MTTSFYNFVPYSRYNLSESESDIHFLVREYRDRINNAMNKQSLKSPFISFAEKKLSFVDLRWLEDNEERFFKDTKNDNVIKLNYLSKCGYITCMIYSENGNQIVVGFSSGLIELAPISNMDAQYGIIHNYSHSIHNTYDNEHNPKLWYPMFYTGKCTKRDETWIRGNYDIFLKDTTNEISFSRWYFSEMGFITAVLFAPNGAHIIVAHSSGMIQMRHGSTGAVMCTLRNIQFPPKPIYALEYSRTEERVCYAASMDGSIYRIEVPMLTASTSDPPQYCIRIDPALECLNMQFFGAPGMANYSTPFISQRSPALGFGIFSEGTKMVVGYADTGVRVYDMETQEVETTYKVHKLRLQFIPKKLQRMHAGQVCGLRCHPTYPNMFATGSWDKTLRIWDIRCKVGCIMTFEGVNICSDSIDLNRNQCIAGSWQTTEALGVWDLVAKKRVCAVRVQNRRPDVDGEYIYACRYWQSADYNRKGKYAIIGGSGTNCVEVINLHNRYITCSYPAAGTVLAVASFQDRIAFGGTATTFNIVKFHDPKHEKEKYRKEEEPEYDYTKAVFEDISFDRLESPSFSTYLDGKSQHKSVIGTGSRSVASKMSTP